MQTLRTIQTLIEKSSNDYLEGQYANVIDMLFDPDIDAEEIEGFASDLLSDVEYHHDCEAADNYQYQSYESIYGCPARL